MNKKYMFMVALTLYGSVRAVDAPRIDYLAHLAQLNDQIEAAIAVGNQDVVSALQAMHAECTKKYQQQCLQHLGYNGIQDAPPVLQNALNKPQQLAMME